ncbi:MAG: DNA topoisomerase (ATP-hydrolyzing) subunit A [Clostridiales bacterium]|nr:DNA topoisomerase (ATP-hydrolyzing) subunit A [Clostridiales bacterium]
MMKKAPEKIPPKPNLPIPQPITKTLSENYMPYAMSVIVSRAIPEIDGFKPSQRKLLYTMYKMGLLTGNRTKSANVVGQTMKLNPHGDQTIYETMVRLSRGNEALLTPFVDSKGNFGKVYSRDMAYAASRYTEVKLDQICAEIFSDIDRDAVDFADNYDNTMKEPALLPTVFPNILVSANLGIAVGMASSICGFNLSEVCKTAIEFLKNPDHEIITTLKAPDFPTGGEIILNRSEMEEIYRTGRGSIKVRAKWRHIPQENLIEITEIPYSTTIEAIMDKTAELIKAGKIREISDMRDETDLSGLKITIDLKRGTDAEKLMQKLFKMTPLMDTFSCNFNILIAGTPRVMGIAEILDEWTAWRIECEKRTLHFDLKKKQEKLHLLKGLQKILLDIDRAIKIVRETDEESEVVPNLMIHFGIDEVQAEYVAEIKLRHLNREYILKRTEETTDLEKEISNIKELLQNRSRIIDRIISDLEGILKKYPTPRKSGIVSNHEVVDYDEEASIEDYPVSVFLTKEGYFKKITPQSLRMSREHKFKDGDVISQELTSQNRSEVIFFTNMQQAYKAHLYEFEDTKASSLGDYLPSKLQMEQGENVLFMCLPDTFSGNLIFVFENGKIAKVDLKSYQTVSNRKRLTSAYSDKSTLVKAFHLEEDAEITLYSNANRLLIFNTSSLVPKTTRSTQGISVMTLKKNQFIIHAELLSNAKIADTVRYKTRTLPAAGAIVKDDDALEKQLTLEE